MGMTGYVIIYMGESLIPEISEIVFPTREQAEEHFENIQERLWEFKEEQVTWWAIRRVVVLR
jgi:hypothetical protein